MQFPLIINFTPTGMIPTKEMTPHVPVGISEIVEDVLKAWEIGITMVHLHARDAKTGEPTYKKELYGKIIEGIRKYAPELVICVSLSGRNFKELAQRADPLFLDGDLKPDMGSLTLSSLNFNRTASVNSPQMIQDLARTMKERGIVPELEAFDIGMINYAKYLEKKQLIEPPYYFNLLLGNIACAQANLMQAGLMISELPEGSYWSLAGIGEAQLKMNSISIAMDGGVRIGLEDNIWYDAGRRKLATNSELLERIHTLAAANERNLMSASEFRKILNLQAGNGKYGRQ
ncbi:3-keto-5-aminohexanoate cleavage protein [Robiginitalea sp. SC105]|uniref:3-keto-5-aminohexanoate cleavage protein n=1 Tax=Robiginitalea sp. SC105 TaxID=2762332 RepID=UPI00163B189E|nr:3-keto-5-aminohexanoate cleavage protein [Robiginitalea sp. SC105]MBC2839931.1 3-keto-5-aminohexanoate cleavage protein [Robiginitalea sp. SC105]